MKNTAKKTINIAKIFLNQRELAFGVSNAEELTGKVTDVLIAEATSICWDWDIFIFLPNSRVYIQLTIFISFLNLGF